MDIVIFHLEVEYGNYNTKGFRKWATQDVVIDTLTQDDQQLSVNSVHPGKLVDQLRYEIGEAYFEHMSSLSPSWNDSRVW